jgi:integrase
VQRLLGAAARLPPTGSIRPTTYVTLLSLLFSTGLRISEALALKLEDVTTDGLVVRQSKFRKSRLVPLHSTAMEGLARYLTVRTRIGTPDRSVFISLRGSGLAYPTVCTTFLALSRSSGLRAGPGTPGCCLHDARHTFAVRSLESCRGRGAEEIARHILALSTYLGHAHPSDTFWYLHATRTLMQGIAAAGESLFGGCP